ncbi:MAG: glycosyltransferase family 4 protein [Saprospiraceae bacterium]|nr:glycosyltransferase family 4 protein [Saprospiraceae bacterium]
MKILLIHTEYKDRGGEETLVDTEMQLLKSAGHEVDLLRFRNAPTALKGVFQFIFLPFNLHSFLRTRKKIHDFKPDIVHLHNWHFAASPSVIVAAQREAVSIVSSLHNFRLICPSAILFHRNKVFLDSIKEAFPWKAIYLGVYRNSRLLTFWLAFTVYLHTKLKTWQRVNRYVINSEAEKEFFIQSKMPLTAEKFTIKYNSLPTKKIKGNNRRQDHFLFVGRLVEEKGVRLLLDVFSKIDLKLVIYGYGPLESEVAKAAGKNTNITFGGALPLDRFPQELAKCTAFIFPSIWFEGMPMTLVEAFATGTPVIASNLGAASSMIIDQINGLHFRAGDAKHLADKLLYWMQLSRNARLEYEKRTRQIYLRDYTPQANLKSLNAIYQDTNSCAKSDK